MPESYAEAWRRLDDGEGADAADGADGARTREATDLQIEGTLQSHDWDGGYRCRCGRAVSLPRDWGRHLLELALEPDGAH
jgi:hypothetical protein